MQCLLFLTSVCGCVLYGSARLTASTPSTGYRTKPACEDPGPIENGIIVKISHYPASRHYQCSPGYRPRGQLKQVCSDEGEWQPPSKPTCVLQEATVHCPIVDVIQGVTRLDSGRSDVGQRATVVCNRGYLMRYNGEYRNNLPVRCSPDGRWSPDQGWSEIPSCTGVKMCSPAPVIRHASMFVDSSEGQAVEGAKVTYRCNSGYTFISGRDMGVLTCTNGHWDWDGALPSCVQSLRCNEPQRILNGDWRTVNDIAAFFSAPYEDEFPVEDEFRVGTKVEYKCDRMYQLLGSAVIECVNDQLWSHYPPKCIPSTETGVYCPSISPIYNGHCGCNEKKDLSFCEPFFKGIQVECICNSGYKISGPSILTCAPNGGWDNELPQCIRESSTNVSGHGSIPSEGHTRMSSLAIVIATACSVLGILLLVMVVMVFRRRKPRPHLCHPTAPAPPPYSRVHNNSVDEHDRVALIGYETQGIVLPSYEEATRSHGRRIGSMRDSGLPGEYRQLPSIPTNMRNNLQTLPETSSNRHSTITTSTVNRDGLSEIFGSRDTVNVSMMSDASTSVTVETFDSGGSNPSNISGRATAGSLGSSNGSLATEDVPLLENAGQDDDNSEGSDEPEDTKES